MKFSILSFFLLLPTILPAQDTVTQQRVNLHVQGTYIYQYKPSFAADYSGLNSLKTKEEKENSITATVFAGVRLWKGAEFYLNPELAGGSGLSGAFGLAASTNGETFRVGNPAPTLYLARAYFKQTFAIGETKYHSTDDQANQLSVREPDNYLRFIIGKYSLGDLFDNNSFANTPRTQFMNWTLMNNGAWDYAANLRGYTLAATAILQLNSMSYKLALAALPVVANGMDLNTDLSQEYSLNGEISKNYRLHERDGHVHLLGYYNNADMGNYQAALQTAGSGDMLEVNDTAIRKYHRTKVGFGVSADQQLSDVVGVFARIGWNDGKNETWCFTEADQSLSAGININGKNWKRKDDNIGIAVVVNGLSKSHKDYLAAGGLGFQLGDGGLNYAPETAAELYYSLKPTLSGIWMTADYQFVLHPGYNADRGPVNVFSVRLHIEL